MDMLTLSTSFLPSESHRAEERRQRLLGFDVERYELGPVVSQEEMGQLAAEIRTSGRLVSSLKNYTPSTSDIRADQHPDATRLLSSLDPAERSVGIAATRHTLEWAARLEKAVVVIDGGTTSADYPVDRVRKLATGRTKGRDPLASLRRHILKDRERSASAHFDALCRSLDRVLKDADRLEISVAISNPLEPHQLPDICEFEALLREFRGASFGGWFDAGHAVHQAWLGFAETKSVQGAWEAALLGSRLHDTRDGEVHLPPGEGDIDFRELLTPALTALPFVVECAEEPSDARIEAGLEAIRLALRGDDEDEARSWEPFLPIIGGD